MHLETRKHGVGKRKREWGISLQEEKISRGYRIRSKKFSARGKAIEFSSKENGLVNRQCSVVVCESGKQQRSDEVGGGDGGFRVAGIRKCLRGCLLWMTEEGRPKAITKRGDGLKRVIMLFFLGKLGVQRGRCGVP